jgi:sugar phosphate isomerase/epimerase
MKRRGFTQTCLAAAGGMVFMDRIKPLFAESDKRGFKIGACDWSLEKRADPAALEVAKQLGLDGVEISLGTTEDDMHLRRPEVQETYRQRIEETGVAAASLAIGELNQVPYKSEARAEGWVKDSIPTAQAMGCDIVLLAFFSEGDILGDKEGTDVVVERLKKVAPLAEEAGVVLGIESWLNAEQHLDILERVGSKAVQVYYDVGNMNHKGYPIYEEIRLLGNDRICQFHAKDGPNLFGQGEVDFAQVRAAIDDIGYRGWIVIEGSKPEGLMESYRKNEAYLRSVFPREV